ncbi:hypothetical protein SAMN04489717_0965 [Actinopolymorpha singaporensis]|uniref:Methyltransferase domain-containing protein n=1 Tax=Actinopolymorpha singaporensis TaxID=117157 RepID=A0A1H1MUF8_9ACTN|nr:hypothetical protein SAMN04489717_0965 [Actinopolymorpha singaporensis]
MPGLAGRLFDRILFLQSFGYAAGPVRALQTAREMLAEDGFILLTRTQPIRYAMERAEQNLWIEAAVEPQMPAEAAERYSQHQVPDEQARDQGPHQS